MSNQEEAVDINQYVESIIQLTKNNTIIISEMELDVDKLEVTGDVICEPGKITRREFFYVAPPCHTADGKRVIGFYLFDTGATIVSLQGDEELFRETIYISLLSYAVVKSFTIYKLFIDRFIDQDNRNNFMLTRVEYMPLAVEIYSEFNDRADVRSIQSWPYALIKFPYIDKLPRYSVLYLEKDEVHIKPIDRNVITEFLYGNYENVKKQLERVLNDNPELAKVIEKLKIY